MKELARSYIEGRIQRARTKEIDKLAAILLEVSEDSPEKHARLTAHNAYPELTASYLSRTTLPKSTRRNIG